MLRYFQTKEFDSPDAPGTGLLMQMPFLEKLDEIRHVLGRPLYINSGFRTEAHNKTLKASVEKSAHTSGWGADIKVNTSQERFQLIDVAIKLGVNRIGTGKTFVHLDMEPGKPEEVAWLYG